MAAEPPEVCSEMIGTSRLCGSVKAWGARGGQLDETPKTGPRILRASCKSFGTAETMNERVGAAITGSGTAKTRRAAAGSTCINCNLVVATVGTLVRKQIEAGTAAEQQRQHKTPELRTLMQAIQ